MLASARNALASTSHTCTRAPSATNARAISSPMPPAPAVTRTRRFLIPRFTLISPCNLSLDNHDVTRNRCGQQRSHREELHIIHKLGLSRRALIKGAGGSLLAVGMPAISRAQSDVIKIGHLTPRTGFLGPLG